MIQNDTIAALSTPTAAAGLGVIRVSGADALYIADAVFCARSEKKLTAMRGYTAAFGHVADTDGVIDECVATVFLTPHSYTGENTVELSCHGGMYILRRVLRALYAAGARPAEAGEFTRRAFENGKLDLSAAEAVMSLIAANGKLAAKTALAAKNGNIYRLMDTVKTALLGVAAQFSAYVDYPDEDIPELSDTALRKTLGDSIATLEKLLRDFDAGRVLREGIDTAIVGSPNVGKSTLMNALSGCERSIVTPIAGTTRDIVEETVKLGEVTLRLSDTAGIRDTGDTVEAIGVQKAYRRLADATLVLAVFDGGRQLDADDRALLAALQDTTAIAVINKADTAQQIEKDEIAAVIPYVVELSAMSGAGVADLQRAVETVTGVCHLDEDTPLLATERQRVCADNALSALVAGRDALDMGMPPDAVSVCVDDAIGAILKLTGERTTEAVVDEVFSRFCVGK